MPYTTRRRGEATFGPKKIEKLEKFVPIGISLTNTIAVQFACCVLRYVGR